MNDRPPALTGAIRKEIENRLYLENGDDPLKRDPHSDEFSRMHFVGMDALRHLTEIEHRYKLRYFTAFQHRDTPLVLAAIYGLDKDTGGGMATAQSLTRMRETLVGRAMQIATQGSIERWVSDHGYSGSLGEIKTRRALVEYLEGKLVELDALVANWRQELASKNAGLQSEIETPEEEMPGPRP